MPPSRRRVLAAGAGLLCAGCAGSAPDGCHRGVHVWTDSFDPASDLPLELDATGRSVVAEAVDGEHADYVTYAEPPLPADAFVTHDGAFYRTDYARTSVERVPAFPMDVRWERGQEAPADAAPVAFDDLPAADREALRAGVVDRERGELPEQRLAVAEFPAPYPDGGDGSRLVGGVTWVRWRDRTLRVEVAGDSGTTRERHTVRYTVERVAASAEAFRRLVADRYLVELDDVPEEQRAVVEAAADKGYDECEPASDALAALRERLSDAERLPHPYGDSWYVAFEGREFRLVVAEWVR